MAVGHEGNLVLPPLTFQRMVIFFFFLLTFFLFLYLEELEDDVELYSAAAPGTTGDT